MDNRGSSTIEIILVLGLIAFIVIEIGKVFNSTRRMDTVSELQSQAYALAQEPIEIGNLLKNDLFACVCSHDSCTSSACSRTSDGQSCALSPGYTSCWTAYPAGQTGQNNFYFQPAGASWSLQALSQPREAIASDARFSRLVKIENIMRDGGGNIVDSGGTADASGKKMTVTVWYDEGGAEHKVELQTLFTAWENL